MSGSDKKGAFVISCDGELLQIFIDEAARAENRPLSSWILEQARKQGIAGAAAFRGFEGFGIDRVIQTTKIVDLSCNLPVMVAVFDSREKISQFRQLIEGKVKKGFIISQRSNLTIFDEKRTVAR